MSKFVITTFLFHYKYTTHCTLFSPYLKLNTHTLPLLKQKTPTLFFLFLFFFSLPPWKEVCLKLMSQLSENVYLFHGKTLMFFVLLFPLESVVFSLVMTLVNNTENKKSKLSYSIFNHFLVSLKKHQKSCFVFQVSCNETTLPLFLTLSPFPLVNLHAFLSSNHKITLLFMLETVLNHIIHDRLVYFKRVHEVYFYNMINIYV